MKGQYHKAAKGFTLIELMIALTLGVLLSVGLVQVFQNTSNISRAETGLSRIQEVGRYAMDILVTDLRRLGYHGCSDPNNMDVTIMANTGAANFDTTSLEAYEVAANGTLSPALTAGDDLENIQATTAAGTITARPGSDLIRIKYADRTSAVLTGNTEPNNANVVFDGNPTCIDKDELVVIADCSSAHIFRNTNDTCNDDGTAKTNSAGEVTFAHAANNNTPHKIQPGYSAGASLLTYNDVTFFVADTGRNTVAGGDVYALYRRVNGNTPEELIEGVEYLQFLYGERLDSGNVRLVSANDASLDLNEVTSIRIGMLVQSLETSLPDNDTRSYTIAGTLIPAAGAISHGGGKYMRKPFVTTVQLRNRRS